MATQPCPTVINECPCDVSPFKNLSSEAPDLPVFFRTNFARYIPPLGSTGGPTPCQVVCESPISQQAADLCAQEQGFECSTAPWSSAVNGGITQPPAPPVPPPGRPVGGLPFIRLFNQAQFCGAPCPDGSVFTYTVPAGVFSALAYGNSAAAIAAGQLKANLEAFTYACRQAQLHRVCLGPLAALFNSCANQPYLATITATGRFLAVAPAADNWALTGGQLPPGLTFHGGSITGGVATIDGTPTQLGTFTFTIQVTAPTGDTMSKQYTVTVSGIPNASTLPNGQTGQAYSQQLLAVGYVTPVFLLVTGQLPDGLSLGSTGIISGTPTTAQTTTATVQVSESATGNACQAPVTITITASLTCVAKTGSIILPGSPLASTLVDTRKALVRRIAIADTFTPALNFFDTALNTLIASPAFTIGGGGLAYRGPVGCFATSVNRFYFMDSTQFNLVAFDLNGVQGATIALAGAINNPVYSPVQDRIYAAYFSGGGTTHIVVINPNTNTVQSDTDTGLNLGASHTFYFPEKLMLWNTNTHARVLSLPSLAFANDFTLVSNYSRNGLAYAANVGQVFIGLGFAGADKSVIAVDPATLLITKTYAMPTGDDSRFLAYDPVTGAILAMTINGSLTVIDPIKQVIVCTIAVNIHGGLGVDYTSGKVYKESDNDGLIDIFQ